MINRLEADANIPETISILMNDHRMILSELIFVESNLYSGGDFAQEAIKTLENLKKFTSLDHHKREEEVLFKWMLNQNQNADETVISRIRSEHQELEHKQQNVLQEIVSLSRDKSAIPSKSLIFNIQDFIDLYREHIEKEEKFIFLIAKGLLSAKQHHTV